MKWFKKLLPERSANQIRSVNNNIERKSDCIGNIQNNCDYSDNNGSHYDLSYGSFKIVDPEEFFECPVHVKNYREEKEFLKMMSEWEIIEDPKQFDNFFTADFEDELITAKTAIANSHSSIDGLYQFNIEKDYALSQKDYYDILLGHRVSYGIPCTSGNLDRIKNSKNCQTSSVSNKGNIPKNFFVDRKLSKSEALTRSIMSAINQFPDCDSSNSRDDSIGSSNQMDHYDIQQYFKLNDNGSILLDISHIGEEKGYGFLMRRSKRIYRNTVQGKAIDETYSVRRSFIDLIKAILQAFRDIIYGHPRNKTTSGGPGESVRAYTLQLANDHTSTFSRNIENFISCTKESREAAPQVVMRNMRQFMNGMKNYLVKHGEGEFHQEVQKARSRLKSDEFLNLDAILEAVMHQLVVLPLREHLYGMFVDYYTRSGDIQLLVENVKYACARNALDFGIRSSVTPPSSAALHQISSLLERLQEAELPLDKLELFLCVIAAIFDATGCPRGQQLGADDFLPILVYVVAKCGFVGAEIEAEFMWGLLQPALLNGEAGYYLTALCSAVHVLKSFMASENEGTGSLDWRSSSLPACSSVLRVIIPDECNGSLQTRTLPVRPHTTTREVCRIIAHKARITNPQDYGLFKLVDGEETLLADSECPQDARIAARGKHCILAYKRIDAKIAWPTATQPSFA